MHVNATSHRPKKFRNVLLANANPHDWRVATMYILLIVVWHWTVLPLTSALVDLEVHASEFDRWGTTGAGNYQFNVVTEVFTNSTAFTGMLTFLLFEGVPGLLFFRISTLRYKPSFGWFAGSWWKTCLWGTLGIPVSGVLIANIMQNEYVEVVSGSLWVLCGAVFPVILFHTNLRCQPAGLCFNCGERNSNADSDKCPHCQTRVVTHRMLKSRWRPVCSDCGYSLRRASGSRCPECGGKFPTNCMSFRRWAVLRFPWDRSPREFIVKAYAKSLMRVAFTPGRAAQNLAIPDRWSRASRWAILHLTALGLVATILSNGQQYLLWLIAKTFPAMPVRASYWAWNEQPTERILIWAAQSVMAWTSVLVFIVLIGCVLSMLIPGRPRAAKLGGVKWSLYLVPVLLLSILAWYGYEFALAPAPIRFITRTSWFNFPTEPMPDWVPVAFYGCWWAIGIAHNQYNKNRRMLACLPYFWVYYGTWILVSRVIFPPGALESLL